MIPSDTESSHESSRNSSGNRQDSETPRTHCIRCGTCCLKGGPTLHLEDRDLLAKGIIKRADLYTIREGETVFDNIRGNASALAGEIIKIKGQGKGYSCIFYDEGQKGCRIYANRPVECCVLKCWDTKDIKAVSGKNRLARKDLIPPDNPVAQLIAAHEQRCSYLAIEKLIERIGGPDANEALDKIIEQLQFDHHLRSVVVERSPLANEEMDFLFGRPLATTIKMFGLQVRQKDKGFLLTPIAGTGSVE